MASSMRRKLLYGGVLFSIVVTLFVTLRVFIEQNDFQSSPSAYFWAFIFTGLIFGGVLLSMVKRGRLLFILAIIFGIVAILIPAFVGGAGWSLLMLAWHWALCLALGNKFLHLLKIFFAHTIERILLSMLLGMGFLQILFFFLGVAGLYSSQIAFGILGLLSLLLCVDLYNIMRKAWKLFLIFIKQPDKQYLSLILSLLMICALGTYIWALSPAIRWDALSYHLAAPEIYLRAGAMVEIPESYNTYWVHYADMAYVLGALTTGQPFPGLMHFSVAGVCAGVVFLIANRLAGKRAGILAFGVFISLPMVGFEAGTAYIDVFPSAYYVGLIFALLLWWVEKQNRWLIVAGILAGLAAGCKINVILLEIPVFLTLIIAISVRYHLSKKTITGAFFFFFSFLMVLAPGLIRDYIWTGNPVFPMFNSIFNSPKWNQAGLFDTAILNEKKIFGFLTLPWTLVFQSQRYYRESAGAILSGLPLLALPWSFGWINRREGRLFTWMICVVAGLATILLFIFSPNLRYLMPVVALVSVLAGLNLDAFIQMTDISGRGFNKVWVIGILLVYLLSTRLGLIVRSNVLPERFPVNVVTGQESQEEYLSRTIPVYDALQFLNQIGNEETKVLSLGNEFRLYTKVHIHGLLFSLEARSLLDSSKGDDDLAKLLYESGYTYLLINEPEREFNPQYYDHSAISQSFLNHHTEIVFYQNRVAIYRLLKPGETLPIPNNIVKNSSFEQLYDGIPIHWNFFGNPEVIYEDGKNAIQITGPESSAGYSYVFQQVDEIKPNEIYTVGYWCVPRDDSAMKLQLQVNWTKLDGTLIDKQETWKDLMPGWNWYYMYIVSPKQPSIAEVYASITGSGVAYCDDICLSEKGCFIEH